MVSWSLDIHTEVESKAQKGHLTCLKFTWLIMSRSGTWTRAVWPQSSCSCHVQQYVCWALWISHWKWAHSQTKSWAVSFNDNSKEGFHVIHEKLSCEKNQEHTALANVMSTGWEVRIHRIKNLCEMRAEPHAFLLLFRRVLMLAGCFLMASSHNRYLKSHESQTELWHQIRESKRDCPDAKKEIIGCQDYGKTHCWCRQK